MPGTSPNNRRFDATVRLNFTGAADFLAHYRTTLSKGSAFVPGDEIYALGSVLQILVDLPVTQDHVELSGVVAAEVATGTKPGMLVHLMPFSDEAQSAIDTCVRAIESQSRGRVLVCHEDKDVRARFRSLLDEHGYSTVTVNSSERALEVMRPGGIDLVFVSLSSQPINGLDFCERAATLSHPPQVGILLIAESSRLPNDERKAAKRLGVMGVMKRTAKADTIINAVEGCFARPRRTKSSSGPSAPAPMSPIPGVSVEATEPNAPAGGLGGTAPHAPVPSGLWNGDEEDPTKPLPAVGGGLDQLIREASGETEPSFEHGLGTPMPPPMPPPLSPDGSTAPHGAIEDDRPTRTHEGEPHPFLEDIHTADAGFVDPLSLESDTAAEIPQVPPTVESSTAPHWRVEPPSFEPTHSEPAEPLDQATRASSTSPSAVPEPLIQEERGTSPWPAGVTGTARVDHTLGAAPVPFEEPEYPEAITERHQFAEMLDRHLQKIGVKTKRTPDGRGVEGELTFRRIKLATPFGSGTPIPSVYLVGVGRDQIKTIAPAPMDELPPIPVAEIHDQETLEGKIMGAFNRRLKAAYRVKGWLSALDVATYLDPERFCCFARHEVGGHAIVFSAISQDEGLIEEINGHALNEIMPAQDRRFSMEGIRTRGDLEFRLDPFIGPAQEALLRKAGRR